MSWRGTPAALPHSSPPTAGRAAYSYTRSTPWSYMDSNIRAQYSQKLLISAMVVRRIVFAVDVGSDDRRGLDEHVVERSRHGSQPDRVGIPRGPAHLDGLRCLLISRDTGNDCDLPSSTHRVGIRAKGW